MADAALTRLGLLCGERRGDRLFRLRKHTKVLEGAWRTMYAGLASLRDSTWIRKRRSRVARMMAWLFQTMAYTGPNGVCAEIGNLCTAARTAALSDGPVPDIIRKWFGTLPKSGKEKRWMLGELSHMKRSLPRGGPRVIEKAERGLFENLTSLHVVPPERLSELEEYCVTLGERLKPTALRALRSPGATLLTKRKDGGLSTDLSELEERLVPTRNIGTDERTGLGYRFAPPTSTLVWRDSEITDKRGFSRPAQPKEDLLHGLAEWNTAERDRGLFRSVSELAELQRKGFRPLVLPSVVAERGWKARAVTAMPALCQLGGQYLRQLCFQVLRRKGASANALAGFEEKAVWRLLRGSKPGVPGDAWVLSSDLSNATDLLSQEAAQSAWKGFCRGANLSDDIRDAGLLLLGPMVLTTRKEASKERQFVKADGLVEGEVETKRGVLMGSPLSWSILCFTQFYAAECARLAPNLPQHWKEGRAKSNWGTTYSICGDDLVALWHPACVQRYEKIMQQLGYKFSEGKHLLSRRGGVFLENLFLVWGRKSLPAYRPRERKLVRVSTTDKLTWAQRVSMRHLGGGELYVEEPRSYYTREDTQKYGSYYYTRIQFLRTVPQKCVIPDPEDESPECRVGPALSALRKHRRADVVDRLGAYFWGELPTVCRKFGVIPQLPRALGGAEIPWGSGRNRNHQKVLASVLYGVFTPLDCTVLSSKWDRRAAGDPGEIASSLVEDTFTRPDRPLKVVRGQGGEIPYTVVADTFGDALSMLANLGVVPSGDVPPPGLLSVLKSLSGTFKRILSRHSWAIMKDLKKAVARYETIRRDWSITSESTTWLPQSNGEGVPVYPNGPVWRNELRRVLDWDKLLSGEVS